MIQYFPAPSVLHINILLSTLFSTSINQYFCFIVSDQVKSKRINGMLSLILLIRHMYLQASRAGKLAKEKKAKNNFL
jgi:hypothetical protein